MDDTQKFGVDNPDQDYLWARISGGHSSRAARRSPTRPRRPRVRGAGGGARRPRSRRELAGPGGRLR
jgi:hypothetical protein